MSCTILIFCVSMLLVLGYKRKKKTTMYAHAISNSSCNNEYIYNGVAHDYYYLYNAFLCYLYVVLRLLAKAAIFSKLLFTLRFSVCLKQVNQVFINVWYKWYIYGRIQYINKLQVVFNTYYQACKWTNFFLHGNDPWIFLNHEFQSQTGQKV